MTKHNDQERALRKRFSDIEDEILAGKHNAQSVFTAMRTAALYIGQPAAQDVSGLRNQAAAHLDEEVARLISLAVPRLREHGSHSLAVMLEAAVNAHRAQAQDGDV